MRYLYDKTTDLFEPYSGNSMVTHRCVREQGIGFDSGLYFSSIIEFASWFMTILLENVINPLGILSIQLKFLFGSIAKTSVDDIVRFPNKRRNGLEKLKRKLLRIL